MRASRRGEGVRPVWCRRSGDTRSLDATGCAVADYPAASDRVIDCHTPRGGTARVRRRRSLTTEDLPREEIPRSIERGPIEALFPFHTSNVLKQISRSIERGPIEARETPAVGLWGGRGYHPACTRSHSNG